MMDSGHCKPSSTTALKPRGIMDRARLSSNQWSILGLTAAAISTAALSLYTLENVKNRAVELTATHQVINFHGLAGAVGPIDYALAGTAFLSCMLLVIWEWRAHAFSRLLRTATPMENFAILTIAGAWLGHSYLFPGLLLAGDTGSHIARFLEMRDLSKAIFRFGRIINILGARSSVSRAH